MHGLGSLKYIHEGLLDEACLEVLRRLPLGQMRPQHIANIMYSLASLRFDHQVLIGATCEHVHSSLDRFKPQEVSNTIYAIALLTYRDDRLSQAATHELH